MDFYIGITKLDLYMSTDLGFIFGYLLLVVFYIINKLAIYSE